MNGVCKCRKGYSGTYCQYHDDGSASFGTIVFYFAIFLFICALIFGLFYGAVRLIRGMEEQSMRIAIEDERIEREDQMQIIQQQDDKIIDKKSGEPTISSKYDH